MLGTESPRSFGTELPLEVFPTPWESRRRRPFGHPAWNRCHHHLARREGGGLRAGCAAAPSIGQSLSWSSLNVCGQPSGGRLLGAREPAERCARGLLSFVSGRLIVTTFAPRRASRSGWQS